MTVGTHDDMHAEHALWREEVSLWKDEIDVWEKELKTAVADLKRLESALRAQQATLEVHWRAIAAHERHLAGHEHALAEFERGGPAKNDLLTTAKDHRHEIPRHAQQREAHERLKRGQRTLMAHWTLGLKALAEPT
jgi:chromosome segregation ATPase